MNREIQQAKHEDHAKLCKIDDCAQSNPERQDLIETAIREERCWFISDSNKALAYGIIHHHFFCLPFIQLVYVEHSERCKGLGIDLIKFFLNYFDAPKVFTSTNKSNLHMQHVLEKLGFTKAGIVEHLDPGDPELIYVKLQKNA